MRIRINGKTEAVDVKANLQDLIMSRGLSPEMVVVEHNRRVVSREEWPAVSLRDDDDVEIVSFVGGG